VINYAQIKSEVTVRLWSSPREIWTYAEIRSIAEVIKDHLQDGGDPDSFLLQQINSDLNSTLDNLVVPVPKWVCLYTWLCIEPSAVILQVVCKIAQLALACELGDERKQIP
jgi:hypothetical protein